MAHARRPGVGSLPHGHPSTVLAPQALLLPSLAPHHPIAQIPRGYCLCSRAPKAPPSSHNALLPTLIHRFSSVTTPGLSPVCNASPLQSWGPLWGVCSRLAPITHLCPVPAGTLTGSLCCPSLLPPTLNTLGGPLSWTLSPPRYATPCTLHFLYAAPRKPFPKPHPCLAAMPVGSLHVPCSPAPSPDGPCCHLQAQTQPLGDIPMCCTPGPASSLTPQVLRLRLLP